MIVTAAEAEIVFFGEQHDDPETHFAEFALLEGIGRIRPRVIGRRSRCSSATHSRWSTATWPVG